MLAKTTITYDLMANSFTWKKKVSLVPLHLTSAIFKVGSITVFFLFFGLKTCGALLVIAIVLLLVTQKLGFDFGDGVVLALTNMTVVSKYKSMLTFHIYIFVRGHFVQTHVLSENILSSCFLSDLHRSNEI